MLEGGVGATNTGDLIVTLSNPVDAAVGYDFTTIDGTAIGAAVPVVGVDDYEVSATAGNVFTGAKADSLTQTVSVNITGDDLVELDETYSVTISNFANAGARAVTLPAATDTGVVTILNDDAATISITDITVNEDVGTATLTISLSAAVDVGVTVDIATQDGTATSSAQGALASDYVAAATSPETFLTGETSKTFDVTINDENLVELEEFLSVIVSNLAASGRDVTVVDNTGIITIVDNDTAALSISLVTNPITLDEAQGTVTFDIALSNPVAVPVTINYGGVNPLMPSSYDDFAGGAGSVTFETFVNATQQVTLDVFDDAIVELDEDFTVQMFGLDAGAIQDADNTDVTVGAPTASFTVLDNDTASLSINDVTIVEGDSGQTLAQFTVTLNNAVSSPVNLNYSTLNGTAVSETTVNYGDEDYDVPDAFSGNLNFIGSAGEQQTINIYVNGDNVVELDESLTVELGGLVAIPNVTILDASGILNIINDDSATISIEASSSVLEGGVGATNTGDLIVTLSNPVDAAVGYDFTTVDGTAIGAVVPVVGVDDYEVSASSGSGNVFTGAKADSLTQTVSVNITGDDLVELDETYSVNVSNLC